MERIASLDALRGRLLPFAPGRHYTNRYAPAESFAPLIDAGRLFAHPAAGGLLLLCDMQRYYRVYFHMDTLGACPVIPADRPLAAELPYDSRRDGHIPALDWLVRGGFSVAAERVRYDCGADRFLPGDGGDFEVSAAVSDDFGGVQALLLASFDPVSGFLPTDGELCVAVSGGYVLRVRGRAGETAGILHCGMESRKNKLLHLAVAPEYRGRGIARALLAGWRRETEASGLPYTLWTAKGNTAAQKLYESCGFTPGKLHAYTLTQEGTVL